MTYKEDMKFQKHLSLWDWQSSGVSARNKFRRSMAPNLGFKVMITIFTTRMLYSYTAIPTKIRDNC